MRKILEKVKEQSSKNRNITYLEWAIIIVAILLPLYSFLYMDTNSVIRCGIDVFKSIFEGKFGNFYDYAKASQVEGLMVHAPTYDIIFYFTVGIWEAPVALAEFITGKTFQDSLFVMIYSKTLLFIFLILSAIMVKKIAIELQIEEPNAKWASFMFLTSGFVFSYLCIAGQYDIIGIFFSLVGVYFYAKNDMKKFALLFTIAVQYKFFPVFIFLPLLLLRVKKISKIIQYIIPPIAVIVLFRLPFLNNAAILEKNAINADMIDRIFRNRISIFETEVPISFLMVGAVCIYCYFKEINGGEENRYYSVYIPFLSLSLLFLSFPFFPYWIIYLVPWIPLLYFMRKELREKYFWIETGMSIGIILAQFSHFDWVFELHNTKKMLMDVLYRYDNLSNPITLSNIVGICQIDDFEYLFYGLYILCLATMIILYRPKENMKYKGEEFNSRYVLWIRFGIQYAIGAMPFLLYIISIIREWIFF